MPALTEEQRARIVAEARLFLDKPWIGQGRSDRGTDCVGLAEMAYIRAGLPLPPTPPNYRNVDSKLLKGVLKRFFRLVKPAEALPADLVVYGVPWEAHLAILAPSNSRHWALNAIHCPLNREVVEARFDLKRGDIRGIYTWQ